MAEDRGLLGIRPRAILRREALLGGGEIENVLKIGPRGGRPVGVAVDGVPLIDRLRSRLDEFRANRPKLLK